MSVEPEINSDVLIIGAGIAGITAAVEAAETGLTVTIIEKRSYIGGKVTQFNKYFPKLCPPSCGLEINIRRLRNNPLIKLFTLAEVLNISEVSGKYLVSVKLNPRYVNDQCTSCGECVKVCPEKRKNDFNFNMDETAAVYLPYPNAYPDKYVIDPLSCRGLSCKKCVDVCRYNAINLTEKAEHLTVGAGSIIWATGWEPYDATKLDILGFGQFPDVITNVMMERLASPDGPTQGKILKISTRKPVESVAFVQCAGSRDVNHLEYCSSVCCMASLKQTGYVREQYPDADIHIHYIDVRSCGLLEDFYSNVQKDNKIFFHRGKVAKVIHDVSTDRLVVVSEDCVSGKLINVPVDLVVLATGMQPAQSGLFPGNDMFDRYGFIKSDGHGVAGCGVSTGPKDVASSVREATGAVLKAIQTIKRK
ncbi:MAG: FAD-dependent oxidoreductase [Candidatus Kryptoniota bacterium]